MVWGGYLLFMDNIFGISDKHFFGNKHFWTQSSLWLKRQRTCSSVSTLAQLSWTVFKSVPCCAQAEMSILCVSQLSDFGCFFDWMLWKIRKSGWPAQPKGVCRREKPAGERWRYCPCSSLPGTLHTTISITSTVSCLTSWSLYKWSNVN